MDWLNKLGSDFMHVGLIIFLGIGFAAYTGKTPAGIRASTPHAPIVKAR